MGEYLKQDVSCINVTGASGAIGGQQVIDAPPDGYTWFATAVQNPGGWRTLGYADISWEDYYGFLSVTSPYILFVKANSPKYATVEALAEDMKKNPGTIKWGHAGLGSMNHLTGEMFLKLMGCQASAVPYKGGREAAIKVIAGEVEFSWCGISDVNDLVESGQIKVIGVAQPEDMPLAPKRGDKYVAPALSKKWASLKGVEKLLYWGVLISRKTPPDVVKKLEEAYNYASGHPEFAKMAASRALTIDPQPREKGDALRSYLQSVYAWGLYDLGMGKKGVTPEQFGILRPENFTWPNDQTAKLIPWPK